jgi:hypothetical protein
MSSGGWSRCSFTLRAAISAGSITSVGARPSVPYFGRFSKRRRPIRAPPAIVPCFSAILPASILLRVHPRLDLIRNDPRYFPRVQRMGLYD